MASTATSTPTATSTASSTPTAAAAATATSTPTSIPSSGAAAAEAAGNALTALPGYPATLPASSSFSPGPFAAGLLLAALAAAAFVMARRRRGVPRLVQVLEQTSLGPKRALVVARLGDELFVLGSSEGGIALLATRPATATATSTASSTATAAPARSAPLAGAAVDLLARLKRRAPGPSFDAALAESVEDVELRRKLAQGQRGSVR